MHVTNSTLPLAPFLLELSLQSDFHIFPYVILPSHTVPLPKKCISRAGRSTWPTYFSLYMPLTFREGALWLLSILPLRTPFQELPPYPISNTSSSTMAIFDTLLTTSHGRGESSTTEANRASLSTFQLSSHSICLMSKYRERSHHSRTYY